MTFRDRYIQEHSAAQFSDIKVKDCTCMDGYCEKSDCLLSDGSCKHECDCTVCGGRENFDDCKETKETEINNMEYSKMKKDELVKQIEELNDELKKLEKYKKYEDGADEMKAMMDIYAERGFSREEVFRLIELAAKIQRC